MKLLFFHTEALFSISEYEDVKYEKRRNNKLRNNRNEHEHLQVALSYLNDT